MTPPTTESSSTEGPDRAENDLENLFFRAGDDPAARPAFYRLLLESVVYAIVEGDAPIDEQGNYTGRGDNIGFIVLNDSRGSYIPAFTSTKRLGELIKGFEVHVKHVGVVGAWMCGMLKFTGHAVILNPSGPLWKKFSPQEVSDLADGKLCEPSVRYVHPGAVAITVPDRIPDGLVGALERYLSSARTVEAAYLAAMASPEAEATPSLLLALRGENDLSSVIRDVSIIAGEVLPSEDPGLDIIALGSSDVLDARFGSAIPPFYQRRGA